MYGSYSDSEQFKTDFLNHLTLYFLGLIRKPNSVVINRKEPKLLLQGVLKGKPSTKLNVVYKDWLSIKRLDTLKVDIVNKINEIENINLIEPIVEKQEDTKSEAVKTPKALNIDIDFYKQLTLPSLEPLGQQLVNVTEKTASIIELYANEIGKKISDNFFYLANLKKSKNPIAAITGNGWSLYGSDDEKQKYRDIIELQKLIIEYNHLTNYFSKLSSMPYLEICISNIGNTFDEDIDVYLKIPKNCYCTINNLPLPEDDIIEIFNGGLVNIIFKPKETVSIGEYTDYPNHLFSPPTKLPSSLYSKSRQDEIDEAKDTYFQFMKELFCYNEYEDEDYNILYFNLKYLKQNISIFIPTNIHFNVLPETINYEIKSKHCADVVEGTLELLYL